MKPLLITNKKKTGALWKGSIISLSMRVIMLLGSMLFFAFIVAPLAVSHLDRKSASVYLRAFFPRYYSWGVIVTAVALLGALTADPLPIALLLAILAGFVFSRQWLMHRINHYSDLQKTGDKAAGKKFAHLHRFSVLINSLQMIALIGISLNLLEVI